METNSLYLSWVLAGLCIIVSFAALYYAGEAKSTIRRQINEFVDKTVSKIEGETDDIKKKLGEAKMHINEQLIKSRSHQESLREELVDTKKQLADLRAELKNLDNRILPKYKR